MRRAADQPVPGRAYVLGVAAVGVLAQTEAGDHHRIALGVAVIAGGVHDTGHVDSPDHGEPAHDPARPGRGQRVLVVDAGPRGADDDVAFVQIVEGDVLEAPPGLPSSLCTRYARNGSMVLLLLLVRGAASPRLRIPCGRESYTIARVRARTRAKDDARRTGMRLIEESALSFDEIRERFRWNVPARYNIGVDICDRHADIGDRTAIFARTRKGRSGPSRSPS